MAEKKKKIAKRNIPFRVSGDLKDEVEMEMKQRREDINWQAFLTALVESRHRATSISPARDIKLEADQDRAGVKMVSFRCKREDEAIHQQVQDIIRDKSMRALLQVVCAWAGEKLRTQGSEIKTGQG